MLNILSIMEKIHDIQKGIRKVRMSDDNINRSNFCNRIEKYVEMSDKEYERDSVLEVIFEARAAYCLGFKDGVRLAMEIFK